MRNTLLAGLLGVALVAPPGIALAQAVPSPEAMTIAAELNGLVGEVQIEAIVDASVRSMWESARTFFVPPEASALAHAEIDALAITTLAEAFTAPLSTFIDATLPEITQMTAERFQLTELQSILAFYRSSAGAAVLAVLPELIGASTTAAIAGSPQGIEIVWNAVLAVDAELRAAGLPGLSLTDSPPPLNPIMPPTAPDPNPPGFAAAREFVGTLPGMETLGQGIAADLSDQLWPVVAADLPAAVDASLRSRLRSVLDTSIANGVATLVGTTLEQMAITAAIGIVEADLRQATAFFSSPLGTRWLTESNAITEVLMPRMVETMDNATPELEAAMIGLLTEIEAILARDGVVMPMRR